MIIEFDDFGTGHIISDQCQSHDCRDVLVKLKEANPKFKVTLFAIPDQMTIELLSWSIANASWVQLAVHGFGHGSNYECEKLTYEEFDALMKAPLRKMIIDAYFVGGFRAPGWQISDGAYKWLLDNGWWVADQNYNTDRRPKELDAYVNNSNIFYVVDKDHPNDMAHWNPLDVHHGHVWNCCGNGIYEQFDYLMDLIKKTDDFKFVSELFV